MFAPVRLRDVTNILEHYSATEAINTASNVQRNCPLEEAICISFLAEVFSKKLNGA